MIKLLVSLFIALLSTGCGTNESGLYAVQAITGPTGNQGVQGATGSSGTGVTTIQLCVGFIPSYPNVFPEYAVCIQNKLYGVYSANGGFLTYMPEGTYSSNGINSSCTFTVGHNCTIN